MRDGLGQGDRCRSASHSAAPALESNPAAWKVNELYLQWFSDPEAKSLADRLLAAVGQGLPLQSAVLDVSHSKGDSPEGGTSPARTLLSPSSPTASPPRSNGCSSPGKQGHPGLLLTSAMLSPSAPATATACPEPMDLSEVGSAPVDTSAEVLPTPCWNPVAVEPPAASSPPSAKRGIDRSGSAGDEGPHESGMTPSKRPSVDRLPPLLLGVGRVTAPALKEQGDELRVLLADSGLELDAPLEPQQLARLLPQLPGGRMSSYLARALWHKLLLLQSTVRGVGGDDDDDGNGVTARSLLTFFERHLAGACDEARLVRVLGVGAWGPFGWASAASFEIGDLELLLAEVLARHPSLSLLDGDVQHAQQYARTVALRIFFNADPLRSGKVTEAQLRRGGGDVHEALVALDTHASEDINFEGKYFSYEHFYVISVRFAELDDDGDGLLSVDDLMRYGSGCLVPAAAERIFAMRWTGLQTATHTRPAMDYADFVRFILAEEDKSSATALSFWFAVLDVDGDGVVSPCDMEHFYAQQAARLQHCGHDPARFSDILCQLHDAVKPAARDRPLSSRRPSGFTRSDLHRSKQCGLVANTLTNLTKFLQIEAQEIQAIREAQSTPLLSEWERWAAAEYVRIVEVEDELGGDDGHEWLGWDAWGDSIGLGPSGARESPF